MVTFVPPRNLHSAGIAPIRKRLLIRYGTTDTRDESGDHNCGAVRLCHA